jgi:hypothetical protein
MIKKACLAAAIIFICISAFAQTTLLPIGSEDLYLLDRLETRSGRLCDSLAAGDRPESRRNAVHFLEYIQSKNKISSLTDTNKVNGSINKLKTGLSKIDEYNIRQMISENGEWAAKDNETIFSKHPIFKTFYVTPYDLIHVKTEDFIMDKDFFLVINPVISTTVLEQHNTPEAPGSISKMLINNSHGAEIRGWISRKLGFYTSLTDNQEKYPYPVYKLASNPMRQAVPGGDYFLNTSPNYYDYMQASGYINFDAIKNHLNIIFGSGKHFIGDGISSLFLTDYSSNTPFLQIQTRIWHINYECLYLELTPQYDKRLGDGLLYHKYSTMHYFTWNATRWLNLGFFEAEVFDRPNIYEISYLNPVILSTAINRFNGDGDKSLLGFDGKIIAAKHVQLYGQVMFNEFRAAELFSNKGWYGNKWGIQAGAKYFDAFSIKNLDLQGEIDAVRPYTYTAKDTLANYTNYNQPLADPLGSGFVKAIGVIRYQPVKNLYLSLKGTYYVQGLDTGGLNLGNNVFNPYGSADQVYGVKLINGPRAHCEIINLNVSYQLFRNVFIDLGGTYRKYVTNVSDGMTSTGPVNGPLTTDYVYFGLRINTVRRDYDFF